MYLWRKRLSQFSEEQGTAAVILALALTVLTGIAAVVLDAGLLYLQQTRLSNACDAAALAASQELPDDMPNAHLTAAYFAQLNQCPPENIKVEVTEDKREVKVRGQRTLSLFFARILGQDTGEVAAQATARIDGISSLTGAAPLSIGNQSFVYGEEYYLKDSPGYNSDPYHRSGWYGCLSLGGNGASRYQDNLIYGYNGVLRIGDIKYTETGNMSGSTCFGIAHRIVACNHVPRCTFDHFSPDCPRVLLVPVVDPYEYYSNQVTRVKIVGFAAFFVENFVSTGNDNYIIGRFVQMVMSSQDPGSNTDYGLYTTRLVQ